MKLASGTVAIDILALRKQFNLRPDEKAEEYYVQRYFQGSCWLVLTDAGGQIYHEWRRIIGSNKTYDQAMKVVEGWSRDKPQLVYLDEEGNPLVVESHKHDQKMDALKNKLALIEKGIIVVPEKAKNKMICELDPSKVLELGDDYGPEAVWHNAPNGKVYWNRFFGDRAYTPMAPMCDCERIATMGDRLMFRHGGIGDKPELFVAPKGTVTSGWVVGLLKPKFD